MVGILLTNFILSGSTCFRCQWLGVLHGSDSLVALKRVYILDTVLLACGDALLTAFAARQLRDARLALLVTAPGLLHCALPPIEQTAYP